MGNVESRLYKLVDQARCLSRDHRHLLFLFVRTFLRDFALAWSIRGGVGFLPHLLKLLHTRNFNILEALRISFGGTAIRFGSFVALYFAIFKLVEKVAERRRGADSWNAFIGGLIGSMAILVEEEGTRWILAQYLLVRALGSAWSNVQRKFPFIDPYAYYGDAALFALCSGQAVYNFVVRPETVDPAYSHFLTQVTQMDPAVIDLFRRRIKTGQLDMSVFGSLVGKWASRGVDIAPLLGNCNSVTCSIIHPGRTCWNRIIWVLYANFKMVFPMYFSLHLIPPLLFRFKKSIARLNETMLCAIRNGAQSSAFMSIYVVIFQTMLCGQRNLMELGLIKDEWRMAFWWMGLLSASSIFIEKKPRRAELALYMLPRAGVAFYRGLVDKGWAAIIPNGELLMMAFSMAVLMKTFRKDQSMLSPIVARIFKQFL